MSSSYSSLDWVLSHWPNSLCIDLFVFISVYFVFFHTAYLLYYCEHGGVDLMGLKCNPLDLSSFAALTLLVVSFDLTCKNSSPI